MKGGLRAYGFTIVETLIVLAISSGMLMATILMVSGQQSKSQFQQAINAVTQQLQQTIDDVANGYYSTSNIQCISSVGGPVITSGNTELGTNDACVLVGKVVQFDSKPNPQQYIAYSMVGLRTNSGASPIAIAPGVAGGSHKDVPDKSVKAALASGLNLVYATRDLSDVTRKEAFGVISGNVLNSGNGLDNSGSQLVGLYAIDSTKATLDNNSNVELIDNFSNFKLLTNGFNICLASGTTNQSGLIIIGGNKSKLSVALTIKAGKTC